MEGRETNDNFDLPLGHYRDGRDRSEKLEGDSAIEHRQLPRVSGDRGYVTRDDFVLPFDAPELVCRGEVDPHWPVIALKTQQVVDACLQSASDGGRLIELNEAMGGK